MIKYTNKWNGVILPIEIERETKASVFFKDGSRCAKQTGNAIYQTYMGTIYADTPKEVYEFMKKFHEKIIRRKEASLEYQKKSLQEMETHWKNFMDENPGIKGSEAGKKLRRIIKKKE